MRALLGGHAYPFARFRPHGEGFRRVGPKVNGPLSGALAGLTFGPSCTASPGEGGRTPGPQSEGDLPDPLCTRGRAGRRCLLHISYSQTRDTCCVRPQGRARRSAMSNPRLMRHFGGHFCTDDDLGPLIHALHGKVP